MGPRFTFAVVGRQIDKFYPHERPTRPDDGRAVMGNGPANQPIRPASVSKDKIKNVIIRDGHQHQDRRPDHEHHPEQRVQERHF